MQFLNQPLPPEMDWRGGRMNEEEGWRG